MVSRALSRIKFGSGHDALMVIWESGFMEDIAIYSINSRNEILPYISFHNPSRIKDAIQGIGILSQNNSHIGIDIFIIPETSFIRNHWQRKYISMMKKLSLKNIKIISSNAHSLGKKSIGRATNCPYCNYLCSIYSAHHRYNITCKVDRKCKYTEWDLFPIAYYCLLTYYKK